MTGVAYVDASAIVKLVLDEQDTPSMVRWFIETARAATSVVGVIETRRAISRRPHDSAVLSLIMDMFITLELSDTITAAASRVSPAGLRTLDAIHVATALSIGPDLESFVTYDDRLADAARAVGLPVVRPS